MPMGRNSMTEYVTSREDLFPPGSDIPGFLKPRAKSKNRAKKKNPNIK